MYLNLPGDYRIHGTDIDKIFGIGMQITHGCVRMYPEDIEALYKSVPIGTPVYIVKQPIKVGWLNNTLYIEAHPDLEGEEKTQDQRYAAALALIEKANNGVVPDFDQVALAQAIKDLDGTPVALYEGLAPEQEELQDVAPEIKPVVKQSATKTKAPKAASSKKSVQTSAATTKKSAAVKKAEPVVASKAKAKVKEAGVASKPAPAVKKQVNTNATPKPSSSTGGYYHGT